MINVYLISRVLVMVDEFKLFSEVYCCHQYKVAQDLKVLDCEN